MGTNNSTLTLSKYYFIPMLIRVIPMLQETRSYFTVVVLNPVLPRVLHLLFFFFFFPFIMEQISLGLLNDAVKILYMLSM